MLENKLERTKGDFSLNTRLQALLCTRFTNIRKRPVGKAILLLALLLTLAPPQPGSGAPDVSRGVLTYNLSGPMPDTAAVQAYKVSPDGKTVYFNADINLNERAELFKVPITGGPLTRLSGDMINGGSVWADFEVSPDGRYVVYRADQEQDDVYELYSVDLQTGVIMKLNNSLSSSLKDVTHYKISPNSAWVVFQVNTDNGAPYDLYSVPITGPVGPQVPLNETTSSDRTIFNFEITPDSQRVIFNIDRTASDPTALYNATLDGSASVVLHADPSGVGADGVTAFHLAPNGARVVYKDKPRGDSGTNLYSVPVNGGVSQQLSPNMPDFATIYNFKIACTSDTTCSRVVYLADQEVSNRDDLYSVAIDAQGSTRLNEAIVVDGGKVQVDFSITPDGLWVLYRSNPTNLNTNNLYRIGIKGVSTTRRQINPTLPAGQTVSGYELSPTGIGVVYRANPGADKLFQLFSYHFVSATTYQLTHITSSSVLLTSEFTISPDNTAVAFLADLDVDNQWDLYTVNTMGIGQVKWSPPFNQPTGSVKAVTILPDSESVLYLADTNHDQMHELYSGVWGYQVFLPLTNR